MLLLPLALGCSEWEPVAPIEVVISATDNWPAALSVTDTAVLRVQVTQAAGGTPVTGLVVEWLSGDPAILEITRNEPPDSNDVEGALAAQLQAKIAARRSGEADITVRVTRRGFEPSELIVPMMVRPLTIVPTRPWRDVMAVIDSDTLELLVSNLAGNPVHNIRVHWDAGEKELIRLIDLPGNPQDTTDARFRAAVLGLSRGVGEVMVTVSRDGFESTILVDTIMVKDVKVLERGPAGWSDTISVSDSVLFEAGFENTDGEGMEDLRVAWITGDPEILGVAADPLRETDATRADTLARRRRGVVVGRRSGMTDVVVVVDREGFQPTTYRSTVTVAPLTISEGTGVWPDELTSTDTVLVTVDLQNHDGIQVQREVEWGSSDAARVRVEPLAEPYSARVVAQDTGVAEVSVMFAQNGFDHSELKRTIHTGAISVTALAWADTLTVLETAVFEVEVRGVDGRLLEGRAVEWRPADAAVMSASVIAPHQATIIAKSRGGVVLSAAVVQNGVDRASVEDTVFVNERWTSVSAGKRHTCAINFHGEGFCWGADSTGALGNGQPVSQTRPTPIVAIAPLSFRTISAGEEGTCGVTVQRIVFCWGWGNRGRLGNGNDLEANQFLPSPIVGSDAFPSVTTGAAACGVATDLRAMCWGDNSAGQLGVVDTPPNLLHRCIGDIPCSLVPRQVDPVASGPDSYTLIDVGVTHTCGVIGSEGSLGYCWGRNDLGQLGNGSLADAVTPSRVDLPVAVNAIGAGGRFTCAVGADAQAYCWGSNAHGQLGYASAETCSGLACSTAPAVAAVPAPVDTIIAVGTSHACTLTNAGLAYCWGKGDSGQLGDGGSQSRSVPVAIQGFRFTVLSAGDEHTCGITFGDGALYCWGSGADGRLGTGRSTDEARPVRVATPPQE